MNYQQQLVAHLGSYKATQLGVVEPGVYRHRGRDLEYHHVLPRHLSELNVLDLARDPVQRFFASQPHARHRYFHHLNSSQAFALNLFCPFFDGTIEGAEALLRAFGDPGPLTGWQPEFVPDSGEGTNIDVTWSTPNRRTLCEVKLSENEFGKARNDARHRTKVELLYAPGLRGHVSSDLLQVPRFLSAYQILRNLWHLVNVPDSELVFLMPRANAKLWTTLGRVLEQVAEPTRSRIRVVAMEDVLSHLVDDEQCPAELRRHAADMCAKYIVPAV